VVTLTAKISSDLHEKIRNLCEDKGITVSEFVRKSLLQGLQGVCPSGKLVKQQGNTGIRGGVKMEDKELIQLMEKIEGLKRERLEDKHNIERSLEELSRAVRDLKGVIEGVRDAQRARETELRTLREGFLRLSDVPTREEIKSLVNQCLVDPSSPACAKLTEMVSDIVKTEKKDKGKIEIDHESWEEVWSCPECRETLISQAVKYASQDILKAIAGDNEKKQELIDQAAEDWEDVLEKVLPDEERRKVLDKIVKRWDEEHRKSSFF